MSRRAFTARGLFVSRGNGVVAALAAPALIMWIIFLLVAVGIIGYLSARIQSDAIFWIVVVFVLIIVAGVGLLAFSFASSTPATTGMGK